MSTETFVDDRGRLRERRVMPDERRELQVARVVSIAPVVVELNGRERQLHKRLASLSAIAVGDYILVCRTEAGIIALGEVI